VEFLKDKAAVDSLPGLSIVRLRYAQLLKRDVDSTSATLCCRHRFIESGICQRTVVDSKSILGELARVSEFVSELNLKLLVFFLEGLHVYIKRGNCPL